MIREIWEIEMKPKKSILALAASLFILASLPGLASAGGSFHIGLGYGYSHFGGNGGHHRWSGHHPYRSSFSCMPRLHRRRGYWDSQHIGFGRDYWHTGLRVETPVVIVQPRVIIKKKVIVDPTYNTDTQKLFKRLRVKKAELLRKLKVTDKKRRQEIISELAGFAFDEKVKKALEDILLFDPDPELRIEAAKSFAKVKNDKAIPTLEKVRIEDPAEEVRKEADKAIKTIMG
jgi:hypothetical protein